MEQLLHMMDVKEDPELLELAYEVYRHIPNVPLRPGEDEAIVASLIRIGRTSPSWHQRLRALVNLQVIYFRTIFVTCAKTRESVFEAVSDMLADQQPEVRTYASNTLAGMIRCLPKRIRNPVIERLKAKFVAALERNPMPTRSEPRPGPGGTPLTPGTPTNDAPRSATTADAQAQVVRRHAAVLGLSALIEAFPYATPPPKWMPEVLATLASRAASDPGIVGKATKATLSDFKKTRHDSWSVDQRVSGGWSDSWSRAGGANRDRRSTLRRSNWRTSRACCGRATLHEVRMRCGADTHAHKPGRRI
jgi:proteasome activator subunit 4